MSADAEIGRSGPIHSGPRADGPQFLQRLSGIATLTARFVAAVEGTNAVILDTRKTTPGCGPREVRGPVRRRHNHRIGLHDAVLIKDNHLAYCVS